MFLKVLSGILIAGGSVYWSPGMWWSSSTSTVTSGWRRTG